MVEPAPSAAAGDEPLYHPVPRLESSDKILLLPAPVAFWLAGGCFAWFVAWQLAALLTGAPPADLMGDWRLWAFGIVSVLVGACGAFVRPGGLDLARWLGVLVDYALLPRRAVWKPVGRGILWW